MWHDSVYVVHPCGMIQDAEYVNYRDLRGKYTAPDRWDPSSSAKQTVGLDSIRIGGLPLPACGGAGARKTGFFVVWWSTHERSADSDDAAYTLRGQTAADPLEQGHAREEAE